MQKKIIILVVGLLLLGVGYFYKAEISGFFEKSKTKITQTATASASGTSTPSINLGSDDKNCTAPLQPRPVEDGKLMGVVEVGASGFNAFAIRINRNDDYEVKYKEFGESLAYEGFATYDDVKVGLRKYLSKLFELGVAGNNMHFVISSGALKNPKTQLIMDGIRKLGYVVNPVTAEQEGKYALTALLPKDYYNNSFVVDIGSGNTKISYIQNGKIQSFETFGAKYNQITGLEQSTVEKEVSISANKVPAQFRQNMFIIGGIPYKLSKEVCETNRYVSLKTPDKYSISQDNAKWNAGLSIYNAIWTTTQPKQVIFDNDANFVIGFLMNLN